MSMTPREYSVFESTYGAAFARYAKPLGSDGASRASDDDAAVIAGDLARRAVEAWRRMMASMP